jgi:hypothetical protein
MMDREIVTAIETMEEALGVILKATIPEKEHLVLARVCISEWLDGCDPRRVAGDHGFLLINSTQK